jgi:hypothetical protein
LGGNIKDAVQIALTKLKDPLLALLMARVTEKENFDLTSAQEPQKKEESVIERIYLEEFINRGKKLEDPYLQNIGFWQRKEYIKAVNAFQVEP